MDLEKKDPMGPQNPPPPPPGNQQQYQQPKNQYQQPYGGGNPNQPPLSENDAKLYATLAHLGFVIGGFIVPLVIWLVFRERSSFVDAHGKEALNWQLTVLVGLIGGIILTFIFIGILVLAAVGICSLIFGIMGLIAANKGEYYKYPLSIPFIS